MSRDAKYSGVPTARVVPAPTVVPSKRKLTGMEIGGVTPVGLPDDMAIWIDRRVMQRESVILGGGNRETKIVTTPQIFQHIPNTKIVDGLADVISC